MGYTQELHGVFAPDGEGEQPTPAIKSTDPGTPHNWRVTHCPAGAHSYVHIGDLNATDAAIEVIAEDAGDRAAITYARTVPWQDGRRHIARLDVGSREDGGFFACERIDEQPARNETDASVADLRYRLAAIERLVGHVASSSEDRTASLVASAIHEIARSARTPDDAVLNLLPPEWSTILNGLTR